MFLSFNFILDPKPVKRLSLHSGSDQRPPQLVPLVISERLSAVTREPVLSSSDAGHGTKPSTETESSADGRLRLDNGQVLDHDRMMLNETRINTHQAIINVGIHTCMFTTHTHTHTNLHIFDLRVISM